VAHGIIDGNLFWLKNQDFYNIKIGNCSNGPIYKNADKIALDEVVSFFESEFKNERSF
jgi:hypothetical protein